jgi:hypothetical protein
VPPVISLEVPVVDLGFFGELLNEVEGTGKKMLSNNITNREKDFTFHLLCQYISPQFGMLASSAIHNSWEFYCTGQACGNCPYSIT